MHLFTQLSVPHTYACLDTIHKKEKMKEYKFSSEHQNLKDISMSKVKQSHIFLWKEKSGQHMAKFLGTHVSGLFFF